VLWLARLFLGVSVIPFRKILEGLIFWDMTVYLLVNSYKLLGGASFLHLLGLISLLCPCLLDSFYSEDGDSRLLCNICNCLPINTIHMLEYFSLHQNCLKNLKS